MWVTCSYFHWKSLKSLTIPVGFQKYFISIGPKQGASQTTKWPHSPASEFFPGPRALCELELLCPDSKHFYLNDPYLSCYVTRTGYPILVFCCPTRTEKNLQKFLQSIKHLHEANFSPSSSHLNKGNQHMAWVPALCWALYKRYTKKLLKTQSLLSGNLRFSGGDRYLNKQLRVQLVSTHQRKSRILWAQI